MQSGSPYPGWGSTRASAYFSAGLSPTSPSSSSHASATLGRSRHPRHDRVLSSFTGASPVPAPNIGTSSTTGSHVSMASNPVADNWRAATSTEAMVPRTFSTSNLRQNVSSWMPTRLTSPYRVLSAAGLPEDFYTSCLSWGTRRMALALPGDLVLFHPNHPRQASSTACTSAAPSTANGSSDAATSPNTFSLQRCSTAVAMTRCHETSCFLGLSNGAVELYEGREDGTLQCTVAFAMPSPPTEYLNALASGGTGVGRSLTLPEASRAARAMSLLSSSVSSIGCVGTSSRHPWLGAAATAARGLVALDCRQPKPAIHFGGEAELSRDEREIALPQAASPSSPGPLDGAAVPLSRLDRLQRATSFLRRHDRLCSVSWNTTGSLVATGSSSGIVKVWSLSAPQRPLHTLLVDGDCSVKALCFHPGNPYVLLLGASAGPAGLRTYDLSGAEPILTSYGATAAPVTQALYDPEGHYAVTSAGMPATPTTSSSTHPLSGMTVWGEVGLGGTSVPEHGVPWHYSSPSRPSVASSSSAMGASTSAAHLDDSWEEMELLGSSLSATLDAAGALTSSSESGGTAAAHSSPPCSLVVWRCGTRCRENDLREALMLRACQRSGVSSREDIVRFDDPFDYDNREEQPMADDTSDAAAYSSRRAGGAVRSVNVPTASHGNSGDTFPRSEWMPMYSLPGHRARPLLICAPFAQSPFAGCYASIAGGEDGTIRFWRLFEAISGASHWQHRRQAQQRSVMTLEDIDPLTTPVLR